MKNKEIRKNEYKCSCENLREEEKEKFNELEKYGRKKILGLF